MGASFGCCMDEEQMPQKQNTEPPQKIREYHEDVSTYSGKIIRDRTKKASFGEQESASSNTTTLPMDNILDYSLTQSQTDAIEVDQADIETSTDSKPHAHLVSVDDTKVPNDTCTETETVTVTTEAIETEINLESDHEIDENEDKQQVKEQTPTEAIEKETINDETDDNETDTKQEELITIHTQTQNNKEVHLEQEEEQEQDITPVPKDTNETPPKSVDDEAEQAEIQMAKKEEDEIVETLQVRNAEAQFFETLMDETADESDDVVTIAKDDDNVVSLQLNKEEKEEDEEDAAPKGLLLKKYKSQRQMLDDECIKVLLTMNVPDDAFEFLGDRSSYVLPFEDKEALFHLERDLRKIKFALKNIAVSEQRKYAKIAILKHYTILNAMYTKYCKIGGDEHWLNYDGYISLLRDVGIITMNRNNERYFEIFHSLFDYHSKHSHKAGAGTGSQSKHATQLSEMYGATQFHDQDPWTGIWCLVRDKERIHRMEKEQRQREEKERKLAKTKKKKVKLNTRRAKTVEKTMKRKLSLKQKSEQYFEKYKLRKIGDKRIIGCMNNIHHAELGGTFDANNYTKAHIEISFKKRRIKVHNQRRLWKCELIPPESIVDDIMMKVKWAEINEKAAKKKEGKIRLYKYDELHDDDVDIPLAQFVGLSRGEFFDAMLCCSRFLDCDEEDENVPFIGGFLGRIDDEKAEENLSQDDLYKKFDVLVTQYIDEYIYKNHCELEKYIEDEEIKAKLYKCNTVLMKLFKKYADLDNSEFTTKQNQEIDCDEWSAMALDLCKAAKSLNKSIWKFGGKPSRTEIVQCFTLSKIGNLLNHDEISFSEFQRCLIIFTNFLFKYHPKARYNIVEFETKLDLLLKWCEKLEAQKIRISSASYMRSDTLKRIKRNKSKHQNLYSIQSAHSYHGATISGAGDTPKSVRSDNASTMFSSNSLEPRLSAKNQSY